MGDVARTVRENEVISLLFNMHKAFGEKNRRQINAGDVAKYLFVIPLGLEYYLQVPDFQTIVSQTNNQLTETLT